MKGLLIHAACPDRQERLDELSKLPVEWYACEPRWPQFRDEIDRVAPDFVVIDLSRAISHGLEAAGYLQQAEPYRDLPIFVMNPSKTSRRRLESRLLDITIVTPKTLHNHLKQPF